MFIVSCTCTKIKPLAKMGVFCASKGGYPSFFFHKIYSKFQYASCISNTSSTILYVIYLKVHKNKMTLKIDRLPSRKRFRIKVTPDLHLTYSKNGGNLGLVLKMKNIACSSILLTKHVKYTYLYLFKFVLYSILHVAFKAN